MKNQWILPLGVLIAVTLGIIFWTFEYQHISFVLWLLVIFAVLWYFATVAVSLRPVMSRRKHTAHSQTTSNSTPTIPHVYSSSRSPIKSTRWRIALFIAFLLGGVSILFWGFGYDSFSHVFWFLFVLALLWSCAQLSFLVRPSGRRAAYAHYTDEESIAVKRKPRKKNFFDQFLPGVTMKSGVYNKGDEDVWDGNQKFPPNNN